MSSRYRLGILGKQLDMFDYWTLLPAMNTEKKLTLPLLAREARYRAFKTMRLLFPNRRPTKKNNAWRQEPTADRPKGPPTHRLKKTRSARLLKGATKTSARDSTV